MGRITASRTQLKGDPQFDSLLASKFINCLMWDGKKTTAQRLFYRALDEIGNKVKDQEPIEVFTQALENVKPMIEVRSKRVGGAAYQVPMQVNKARQQSLGDSLAPHGGPRKEGPAQAPGAGGRAGLGLQQGRRRHDPSGKRASHGRGEQSLRSLRVVDPATADTAGRTR